MAEFAESSDGTRIAFDGQGDGPPIVLVAGLLCDRETLRPLARALAPRFLAVVYDRRGRGESADSTPYAAEREIEDLAAVIDTVGGSAAVYGHSSGAALALRAAGAGLPITHLVVHEPPYGPDDEESRAEARALAEAVQTAVDAGRPQDAIGHFMKAMGTPDDVTASMAADPRIRRLAMTMPYDHAVMGDFDEGGAIPASRVRRIGVPTLVLAGTASPAFFRDTADRLTALLPDGRLQVLEGADHGAPAEIVAPAVLAFVADEPA
jgi:pimeloyl-ACP methyl ester carboxylesterase